MNEVGRMTIHLQMGCRNANPILGMQLQTIYPCFAKHICYCTPKYLLGVRKINFCKLASKSRGHGHGVIRAKAGGGEAGKGKGLLLSMIDGEKLLRMVAGATSAPLAQYIASPTTFLHSLDPRVKQAWLLALVVLPSRSHMVIRLGLVLFLIFLSKWTLPRDIWKDQLLRITILSGILFLMLAVGTDGAPPLVQMRTPPPSMLHVPSIPPALGAYSYVLMKIGPLQLTRKGLSVATTASCLSFTVLQSASLCLTTTTPEQLAAALRWYMLPSAYVGAPLDEIILTLLLALRFIGLVFDEVRNIALGIVARGIEWKNLTVLDTIDILFLYLRRIFHNLFNHAEQISQAMLARGFRGTATSHKIYLLTKFAIGRADILAILLLVNSAFFWEWVAASHLYFRYADTKERGRSSKQAYSSCNQSTIFILQPINHYVNTKDFEIIYPCLLAIVLACTFTWIVWVMLERYKFKDWAKTKYACVPAAIVIVRWTLTKSVMGILKPISTQLMNYISFPDHTDKLGYQERVISDITFLTYEIGKKPLMVFTAFSWVFTAIYALWPLIIECWIMTLFSHPECSRKTITIPKVDHALGTKLRIIVFINDLDRCQESVILQVLSAINLVLAVCEINVVLGIDKGLIERAIIKKYGVMKINKSFKDSHELADKYLQKIIQLPLDLPNPSEEQSRNFLEGQLGIFQEPSKGVDSE